MPAGNSWRVLCGGHFLTLLQHDRCIMTADTEVRAQGNLQVRGRDAARRQRSRVLRIPRPVRRGYASVELFPLLSRARRWLPLWPPCP
jgi:hypothetical protein